MPELPDVQVFKEYLDATSLHQQITDVEVGRDDMLEGLSSRSLQRRLRDASLESTQRHGKYLFVEVGDDGWLVMHFGMTGYLDYARTGNPPTHTRVLLRFDNGAHLAYVSQRLLGSIHWSETPGAFVERHRLGIDGLDDDLDIRRFQQLMDSKRGTIKSALMDQQTIAGLGNVYSDEILFQARVHPKAAVSSLDRDTLKEIHRQIRRVLTASVRARAQPEEMPKSFLTRRRGAKNAACPRCGAALETVKVSGRTAYFCPKCQSQ